MSGKTIVVLATLDTKGAEAHYLRQQIEKAGDKAWVIDVGVVGQPATTADTSREEVAAAGGRPLAELLEKSAQVYCLALTTGKPVIENGQLQRYQVDQGSVAIEGAGLNASNIDQFEIITRSAKINAEIQAKHLAVIAGQDKVPVTAPCDYTPVPDGQSQVSGHWSPLPKGSTSRPCTTTSTTT